MDTSLSEHSRRLNLAQLREQLASLDATVADPNTHCSASQMLTDLAQLLENSKTLNAVVETRQVLILMAVIESKCNQPAKARKYLLQGLAITASRSDHGDHGDHADQTDQTHQTQLTKDHYFLAALSSDLKDYKTAAEHYAIAADLAKNAFGFDTNQRLGIREKQGFALHEANRFAEAYEVNVALLADAEQHFGTHDHHLSTVLINSAQNLYALGKLAEAERYLHRALIVIRANHDIEREQDLVYQLAVVTAEQGREVEARTYLAERIRLLEKLGSGDRVKSAERALGQFDRNRKKTPH